VRVAGKIESGVSAGAVVAAGAVAVMDSMGGMAAVVGSIARGVGVAADWQPMRRTAERRRVDNRLRFRITGMID
jgi:hypothetical protein